MKTPVKPSVSLKEKLPWREWNPGLENDHLTLDDLLQTLPGAKPDEVSKLVRLLENPASPIAFKGAITLERHDCVHILLGRGLLSQDEAFVIGFTMGTSKRVSSTEALLFKLATRYLYPRSYRFSKRDLKVFDLALRLGRRCKADKIFDFPFEEYHHWTVGELRTLLGIDVRQLRAAYLREKIILPDSKASKRLLS